MPDFATLVLGADTRGMEKGADALEDFTRAGAKAETATDKTGKAIKRTGQDADKTSAQVRGMSKAMGVVAAAAGALAGALVASISARKFIDATIQNEKAQAQLAATILSTGSAAGKTIEQLNASAAAMQKVTTFGDEATNAMQGLLLTFTNIKGDQFDAATRAVLDLSTAMGTDLKSAALQVGKALNDPAKGMAALAESGIQFTEAQKDTVKQMLATNDMIGAQTLILGELERQFGGSAEAARGTLGGAFDALGNAWGDLFEIAGPGSEALRVAVEKLVETVSNPAFVAAIQAIGSAMLNALSVMAEGLVFVVDGFGKLASAIPMEQISAAATAFMGWTGLDELAMGIGAVAAAAAIAASPFIAITAAIAGATAAGIYLYTNWEELSQKFPGITGLIAGAFDLVTSAIDAVLPVATFLIEGLIAQVKSTVALIDALLKGDWAKAWDSAKELLTRPLGAAVEAIKKFAADIIDAIKKLASDVLAAAKEIGSNIVSGIAGSIKAKASEIKKSITNLGSDMLGSLKSTLGIQSPSKEFAKLGVHSVDGLIVGMGSKTGDLVDQVTQTGEAAISAADQTLSQGFDSIIDYALGGFEDGFKGLLDIVKNTLKSIAAAFLKQKFIVPITASFSTSGSAPAGSAPAGSIANAATGGGAGGIGGMASTFIGSWGGTGGLLGGASSVISGLGSGGLSGGFGAIGKALGGITQGIGGFGAALGAIALPLAAVGAVFSFFKKKVELLDGGLRITATGMDTLLESFKTEKITRFWGLSKKIRTSFEEMEAADAAPLLKIIGDIQGGIAGAAKALNVGAEVFDAFTAQIQVSTKDMNAEQAQAAVVAALEGFSDQFAAMIPGLADVQREGETATQALQRISNALTVTNTALGGLGLELFDVSIAGAAAASTFADMVGGLDALAQATRYFYDNFYTEQERFDALTQDVAQSFADLNVQMPKSRAEFRALLEAQDMATEAGRRMTAALLNMAPAFNAVMSAAANAVKTQIATAENNIANLTTAIGVQEQIIQQAQQQKAAALQSIAQANQSVEQAAQAVDQAKGQLAQARAAQSNIAAQAAKEAAAARLSAAKDNLGALTGRRDDLLSKMDSDFNAAIDIAKGLARLARDVMGINEDIAEIQRVNALRQLRLMLETGRIDADRLDELTGAATNFGDTFKTQVDMLRAQAQTAQTIAALSDLQTEIANEDRATQLAQLAALNAQIAAAESVVKSIEDQTKAQEAAAKRAEAAAAANATRVAESALKSAQKAAEDAAKQAAITIAAANESIAAADQMEALALAEIAKLQTAITAEQTQISLLQKQLSVLEQILAKPVSSPAAGLATVVSTSNQAAVAALAEEAFIQTSTNGGNAVISTPTVALLTGNAGAVNKLYEDVLGRQADVAGLNFWTGKLQSGEMSLAQIEAALMASGEKATGIIPGFASGGDHAGGWRMVGERGPELEYTPPSRIFNSGQSERMLRGDPEVRRELATLNEYIRELVKLNVKQERRLREIELQGAV